MGPERSIRVDDQGKKPKLPVKFLTWGHDVIAKSCSGSEEIASRGQNNSLCQTNLSPFVTCKVSNGITLSHETFCFLEESLPSICNLYFE